MHDIMSVVCTTDGTANLILVIYGPLSQDCWSHMELTLKNFNMVLHFMICNLCFRAESAWSSLQTLTALSRLYSWFLGSWFTAVREDMEWVDMKRGGEGGEEHWRVGPSQYLGWINANVIVLSHWPHVATQVEQLLNLLLVWKDSDTSCRTCCRVPHVRQQVACISGLVYI